MTNFPFQPTGNTAPLTANTATASVNFVTAWPISGGTVRVANQSASVTGYIAFGDSTVGVAAATGMPILPGTVELFCVGDKQTYAAAIAAAAATMSFTPGQGGI